MSELQSGHITVSEEMYLDHAPEIVWPQLCPTREYDWIEMWQCDLIHSKSGFNELDCVFQTDFPTEYGRETWVTSRFAPHKRIEFIRINAARAIRFVIELEPKAKGTKLNWTQHVTPLNAEGREYVTGKPEAFKAQMGIAKAMLAHYLDTGKMLKGENIGLIEKIKQHVHRGKTG